MLAVQGYPGKYRKGMRIEGLNDVKSGLVFHAGTRIENKLVTSIGGRVLNAIGFGDNLKSAIENAYKIANQINFNGKYFRKDIGQKGLDYK